MPLCKQTTKFFLKSEGFGSCYDCLSTICPKVDGGNAVLIQFGTDPAVAAAYRRQCSEALCVCVLHVALPKKGSRAFSLGADQVILCIRSSGREDRHDWMMSLQLCTSSLLHAALAYKRSCCYSAKDGHTSALLIPACSPLCQRHAGLCKSFDMWLYCDREILQRKTAKTQIQPWSQALHLLDVYSCLSAHCMV